MTLTKQKSYKLPLVSFISFDRKIPSREQANACTASAYSGRGLMTFRFKDAAASIRRTTTEYNYQLDKDQKVYLADLLNERTIRDEDKYKEFLNRFTDDKLAIVVDNILEEHKEEK